MLDHSSQLSHLPHRSFSHYHRRPRNRTQYSLSSPLSSTFQLPTPHYSSKSSSLHLHGRHHRPSTLTTHSYNSQATTTISHHSPSVSYSGSPTPHSPALFIPIPHSPTPFSPTPHSPVPYGLQERPITPVTSPRSAVDFTDYTPPPSPSPSSPWYRSVRTLDNFDCGYQRLLSQSSDFSRIGNYGCGQCHYNSPAQDDSAWYMSDCASNCSLTNFSDINTRVVSHHRRRKPKGAPAASAYVTPVRSRFHYCLPGSCRL